MTDAWIPTEVRVHLAHAAVQELASLAAVELLHVKGPAVARALREPVRSTDADVLVRPAHLPALEVALGAHGWAMQTTFAEGSAWRHASTWWHTDFGYLDVHRHWPGVGQEAGAAFDYWWQGRGEAQIANRSCPVPCTDVQFVLLVLHEARSGAGRAGTVELRERWRAAEGAREKIRIIRDATRVSRGAQRIHLGHEPTTLDLVRAQIARLTLALREVSSLRGKRGRPW